MHAIGVAATPPNMPHSASGLKHTFAPCAWSSRATLHWHKQQQQQQQQWQCIHKRRRCPNAPKEARCDSMGLCLTPIPQSSGSSQPHPHFVALACATARPARGAMKVMSLRISSSDSGDDSSGNADSDSSLSSLSSKERGSSSGTSSEDDVVMVPSSESDSDDRPVPATKARLFSTGLIGNYTAPLLLRVGPRQTAPVLKNFTVPVSLPTLPTACLWCVPSPHLTSPCVLGHRFGRLWRGAHSPLVSGAKSVCK